MRKSRIDWLGSAPFLIMHLSALAVLFVPFHWTYVLLCVGSYYLRMFGITGVYHRYFAHKSYKQSRIIQFLMAWLGCTAVQKGPLWWAAHHRLHHKFSDTPKDIHSPLQEGFWWSHMGWIMSDKYVETEIKEVPDLAKYPELLWLNRYHLVPGILYGATIYLLGGFGAFAWGFLLSTVLLWHGTFTINSLSHVYGSKRYQTSDTSRNNFWLALLTMGEGWHNNHHCYMASANQGFFWWEIDASYYVLRLLACFGITRDLKKPPLHLLEAKRMGRGAPSTAEPTSANVQLLQPYSVK